MPDPEVALDPVALHEAGHVLACVQWNVPFQYVTLRPRTRGVDGLVRFGTTIDRMPTMDLVRVLAAGPMAELWLLNTDAAEADGAFCSDLDVLLEAVESEFGRGKRAAQAHRQAAEDVHNMLQDRFHELLTIAIRLERDRTLKPAQIRETCERARRAATQVPVPW